VGNACSSLFPCSQSPNQSPSHPYPMSHSPQLPTQPPDTTLPPRRQQKTAPETAPPQLPQHTHTEYLTIHTPTHDDDANMENGEVRPDLKPENHSRRAFAKSAEPSRWDSSPFRQIPETPVIRSHGPMNTQSPDQEGLDTLDPPRSRATSAQSRATITSRGLSRAPSRASSAASSRPRSGDTTVSSPSPSAAPSAPSRARTPSRASRSSSVGLPMSTPILPDSSIDQPEERAAAAAATAEFPPQGEPPSGSVRRQPYKDARGRFAREPQRSTWNPDDAPGDSQPRSSTDPPRGRPKAKAKAEPKARARKARSDGPRPRAKPRDISSDNVRAPSTQYTPEEDNPPQPSRRLRSKTPAHEGYKQSRDHKAAPISKAKRSHPSKEPMKKRRIG